MEEHDWKAELVEDRTTSLAPAGSRAPGQPLELRWRLAGIAAAVGLAVALIVLYSPESPGVATASAIPSDSPAAGLSIPTAAPPVTSNGGPCATDPTQVDAPAEPTVWDSYGQIRMPPGGLAAFVVPETRRGGSIVVAGARSGPADPQLVATYATGDVVATLEVTLAGWSEAGNALLVLAHEIGATGGDRPCTNLFLVTLEPPGVRQVTMNGPGATIETAALAPGGDRIAYAQAGVVMVHLLDRGESALAECLGVGSFQWSPDERRLLTTCGEVVVVLDAETAARSSFELPEPYGATSATWTGDGSTIIVGAARPADEGAFTVFNLDPATGTFARSLPADLPGTYLASVSPTGQWIIVYRDQLRPPNAPGVVAVAVNLATGAMSDVPVPPRIDPFGDTSFVWLADGDTVVYATAGVLYTTNLATAELAEVGSLPASHFVWANRTP